MAGAVPAPKWVDADVVCWNSQALKAAAAVCGFAGIRRVGVSAQAVVVGRVDAGGASVCGGVAR
eukprot:2043295-Prymnesium_polylepis.1